MAKMVLKTKYINEEAADLCTRRASDDSGAEVSEEDSEISSDDSVAEAMFLGGEDITLDQQPSEEDSDVEWEPDSSPAGKRPREEQDSSSSGEEQPTPTSKRGSTTPSRRSGGRGPGRGRRRWRVVAAGARTSQTGLSTSPEEKWNDVDEPDITPPQPTFRPIRSPGPQLIRTATYTALQLFQLFFTDTVIKTITQNTNDYGSTHHSTPSNPWINITVKDMLAFMSLIIYMGIVKCTAFTDYWRGGKLYSLPFPKQIMTGKKFLRICQSLHLSSLVDDAANEQRRGTPAFDRLAKTKPLYLEMRDACRRNYHPGQEIAIDERMVASKARIGLKQYMKRKPVRWGYKLFVLADSRNGYTWDFFVYEGKYHGNSGKGLSYDSVMELIDIKLLGTGYKLFVDTFYTSPALFRDLLQIKVWACGTIRTNRIGFPTAKNNSLVSKSPRGSIRWIRKDSLLFVQWRDTRDVFMCSTLHTAHSDDTVQRRVKDADGQWQMKDVSIPPAVKEYNRCMGGVDLSDALIGYYKVLHKTQKWYKTFFYHFMDTAIVNAFLLHKEIAKGKGETPLHQKAFRETLAKELGEASSTPKPAPRGAHHKPVHITAHSSSGRLKCRHCYAKTPVKCSFCDVPLCFVPSRDCYNDWHVANNL
ncbi:piggyBac transposable element-derived protein 4-like isoform X1 [Epinephelus fuscoguttatus]|uniref:piggyBac transposable element-derived protein 4-like isoform X1 n=1 Tax=Epinephelus fuscoguttatus TaxID=293821 RepID=UPI0020D097F9|nr:piggyBac transposable element-derived protein 4-like isoform X1 [Epinephelus fuscoguttatus]